MASKTKPFKTISLEGQCLIAMPNMGDPRFQRAVVYICAHSEEGAMGLVVNNHADQLKLTDLLDQLKIHTDIDLGAHKIWAGGPVETNRGFILHSGDYHDHDTTLDVTNEISMTATVDILKDIAEGKGPKEALITLGYTGWGPGQLEFEIRENAWLQCETTTDIIFGDTDTDKWQLSLGTMGIDPSMLSSVGGSA